MIALLLLRISGLEWRGFRLQVTEIGLIVSCILILDAFSRSDPQASLRRPATTVRTNCAQIFLDLFLYLFGNYRDFIVPAKPTDSPTPRPGGRERYASTILQRGDLHLHPFFLYYASAFRTCWHGQTCNDVLYRNMREARGLLYTISLLTT
jgi:hypothetical protein